MISGHGNIETAVQALKKGAYDYIEKPLDLNRVLVAVRNALENNSIIRENKTLKRKIKTQNSSTIIGKSNAIKSILEIIEKVAPTDARVLITGANGSGKELVAKQLHEKSERNKAEFVEVNCAAIPSELIESELFGHEKGAFTGASERRIGRFESANNGTLFLDEIGEIDASTQVKLLRFLESKAIERLGSSKTLELNVRLVCATNRNLLKMVNSGDFREDLYYRLNVITIELPPLRERGDDLSLLLNYFLDEYSAENGFECPKFTKEAQEILENYDWPGNIRELRNFCENMVVLNRGKEINHYDLDPRFTSTKSSTKSKADLATNNLSMEENEKRLLRNALHEARGNRTKAAELMGISRRTLHRKLERWPELDVK